MVALLRFFLASRLTIVSLDEGNKYGRTGPIAFELWETEISYLTGLVNNTFVCLHVFLGCTHTTVCLDIAHSEVKFENTSQNTTFYIEIIILSSHNSNIHTYTHIRLYIQSYIRTYICTYVRTYIHTYIRTYICMYVCRFVQYV